MNNLNNNDELQDLYRDLILDHAHNPRNFGRPDEATHTAEGINPLCGDKLHLYLTIDSDNRIAAAAFEGSGCAISMASASLLTETVKNLPVADADACFVAVTKRLTIRSSDSAAIANVDFKELRALDGVRRYPSRVKCATLAWHALHAAIQHPQSTATTE
ncbi:MAG: SUF system NifU family Fe-S cluster assembly protein [Woeseiaceae bacterium]|nr:SUF system NifU family Fe-S cluster assembly protein [Woeseiaceae bacterium]